MLLRALIPCALDMLKYGCKLRSMTSKVSAADGHKSFELFMNKFNQTLSGTFRPISLIIPFILPTDIKVLDNRPPGFSSLLFLVKKWWLEPNFTVFATMEKIGNIYTSYASIIT